MNTIKTYTIPVIPQALTWQPHRVHFNKRIGVIFSCFDLKHAGHDYTLRKIKQDNHCDYLIAGLQTDPTLDRPEKNKPVQTLDERLEQITSNRYVDEVVIYAKETDLLFLLGQIKPHVRFLGDDYRGKPFTGDHLKIPIIFIDRDHGWSSTELRHRVYAAEEEKMKKVEAFA